MKSISEQLPVHTITIAKKQWSPLIFNMATILTKEVKDVHLEHTIQGILLLNWKLFLSYLWRNPRQERDLSVEPQSTNLPNLKIGRFNPSPPSSGTNLDKEIEKRADSSASFQNTLIGTSSGTLWSTRAHQVRVPSWMNLKRGCTSGSFQFILPRLVPELGGLGYQSGNFQNRQIGTLELHR